MMCTEVIESGEIISRAAYICSSTDHYCSSVAYCQLYVSVAVFFTFKYQLSN